MSYTLINHTKYCQRPYTYDNQKDAALHMIKYRWVHRIIPYSKTSKNYKKSMSEDKMPMLYKGEKQVVCVMKNDAYKKLIEKVKKEEKNEEI